MLSAVVNLTVNLTNRFALLVPCIRYNNIIIIVINQDCLEDDDVDILTGMVARHTIIA
jgi:hypothetical protein